MRYENKRFLVFVQHKETNEKLYYHLDKHPIFVESKNMGTIFYGFEDLEQNLDKIHKTHMLFFDKEQDNYELRIQETIIVEMENNHSLIDFIEYENRHRDVLDER